VSDLAEHHDELRAVARSLLAPTSPTAGGGSSPGPVDWALVADAGWTGMEAPEHLGGSGATFTEVALLAEEMGRTATAGPFLGTVVLGVGALLLVEGTEGPDELLAGVADGTATVAVACADGAVDAVPPAAPFRLDAEGRLHGRAELVPDATEADVVLCLAATEDGPGALVAVRRGDPGLTLEPADLVDATRTAATVRADSGAVSPASVWRLPVPVEEAAGALADRAACALAGDALGGARAMLEATVEYAKVRRQFDRAIGSFQAVKHICADMLVATEVSDRLVAAAVRAVAEGGAAGPAVSMAKAHAGEAGVQVAGAAMQLHGGIGYTWESGVHAHLKRALFDRSAFGSPRAHRRRLVERHRHP
jgi:alkylation response protein AidB-like acyl-CoA dehydrogenase